MTFPAGLAEKTPRSSGRLIGSKTRRNLIRRIAIFRLAAPVGRQPGLYPGFSQFPVEGLKVRILSPPAKSRPRTSRAKSNPLSPGTGGKSAPFRASAFVSSLRPMILGIVAPYATVKASARSENCGRFNLRLRRPAHDYADRRLARGAGSRGRDQRRRRSGAADPVSHRPRGGCFTPD
jgi:hypothetical protein